MRQINDQRPEWRDGNGMASVRSADSRAQRYGAATIALHWLMLLLLVAVYATIELHEVFPRGSGPRAALKTWHFMLGLSVLALVCVRIAARLSGAAPAADKGPTALLARVVHLALYLFMILMPIAGWIVLSAEGDRIPFPGFELPPLVGPDDALAERVEEMHALVGTIGYYLIGLHAAAALFHQYVLRDGILARIMPVRRAPGSILG